MEDLRTHRDRYWFLSSGSTSHEIIWKGGSVPLIRVSFDERFGIDFLENLTPKVIEEGIEIDYFLRLSRRWQEKNPGHERSHIISRWIRSLSHHIEMFLAWILRESEHFIHTVYWQIFLDYSLGRQACIHTRRHENSEELHDIWVFQDWEHDRSGILLRFSQQGRGPMARVEHFTRSFEGITFTEQRRFQIGAWNQCSHLQMDYDSDATSFEDQDS